MTYSCALLFPSCRAFTITNLSLTALISRSPMPHYIVEGFLQFADRTNHIILLQSSPLRDRNCPMAPLTNHKLIKLARRCVDGCQCGVLHLSTVVRTTLLRLEQPKLELRYGSFHNFQESSSFDRKRILRQNIVFALLE